MSIEKLFNHAHLFHQTPDEDSALAETPIAASIDIGGTLVLSQEGRDLILNWASLKEFKKFIDQMAKIREREVAKEKSC